jgi:HAD superfamily phosphatase (TIGR01668 family)
MFWFLTPHLQLASVLDLEAVHLRALRLDGLLLDLDCTLKDHGADEFCAGVADWVRALRDCGFRLCLLSNGRPTRIERFARQLLIPFVAGALKPLPFGCRVALRKLGLPPTRTALVGDQIFADVLAGRLAGLFTILVRPTTTKEPWFTRLKRPLERQVLRRLNKPRIDFRCRSRMGETCHEQRP